MKSKRSIVFLVLCAVMFAALTQPVFAETSDTTVPSDELLFRRVETMQNGWTVITETRLLSQSIAATRSTKTTSTTTTVTHNGATIGIFTIQATFQYNGSTVSVISKSVTRADTYDGWSYTQTSFTSSGGTVTLNGKLTKLVVFTHNFSMSLTCDKNGNVSAS